MKQMMTHLRTRLRTFVKDTRGSSAIETVLVLPLLMWAMLATYTFVDSYRMQSLNLRATYTISDLLTRQWNPVDQPFLVGLGKYHPFLTNNLHDTKMRVTVVYYNEPTNDYRLVWSFSNNSNKPKIKQSDLSTFANVIPVLANADSAIIVETWMDYTPPFQVGITGGEFANRVITSPRFVPQLLWAS